MERIFKLKDLVELLGAIGVIGSLIFVGIQIRQNSDATRATAVQQLGQSWVDWNVATATREIQSALLTVAEFEDPSKAPLVEQKIAESYARSLFSNWSASHYQYLLGVLDKPLWDGVERDIKGSFDSSHPFGRLALWAWKRNRYLYANTFSEFIDFTLAEKASH
jgi:hypothetical protein